MHFEGEFKVKAPVQKVFDFCQDPKKIAKCVPGLQKLDIKSSDEFTAVISAGVSFIKGDFTMNFKVKEKVPPSHATWVAKGSGMGSVIDMDATMDLSSAERGTVMKWQAEARVGGRLASVGQRLITGQAEKIVNELFGRLGTELEAMGSSSDVSHAR